MLKEYLNPETVNCLHPLEIVLLIALFVKEKEEICKALASLLRAHGERVKPSLEVRNDTFDAVLEIEALSEKKGIKGMIKDELEAMDD